MNKKFVSVMCIAAMSISAFSAFADEMKYPFASHPEDGVPAKERIKTMDYFDYFDKYTVTLKTCENGKVTVDLDKVAPRDVVTITPIPDEGFVVDKVYWGEEEVSAGTDGAYKVIAGIGNIEVSATFAAKPAETQKVPFSKTGEGGTVKKDYVNNEDYSALFTEKPVLTYDVSVSAAVNGKVSVDKTNAVKGETVTITVTPDSGYKVKTVTAGDVAVTTVNETTYTFTMPEKNVEVKAEFDAIPPTKYSVTKAEVVNGKIDVDKAEAVKGETVTITVTPDSGYKVKTVTAGDVAVTTVNETTYTFTMPEKNVEVKAEFEAVSATEYNISIAKPKNGGVTVDKFSAAEKEIVKITVKPDENYAVSSVTAGDAKVTKVSETEYTFEMPKADVEVKVVFTKTEKKINVDSSIKNGKVKVDNADPANGDDVTITVVPNAGYKIKAAYVDGKAVTLDKNNEYTFKYENKPVVVSAEFEQAEYSIELIVDKYGSASIEVNDNYSKEKKAVYGDSIYVSTDPNSGYVLDEIVVKTKSDGKKVNVSSSRFTMPADDVKVTVSFKKKSSHSGGSSGGSSVGRIPSSTPLSTAPDVTNTSISVNGDNIKATSSGVLLDSSKTANGFSVKYIAAKENDYVVIDGNGNVVAKSTFDNENKVLKAVGPDGTYSVKQAVGGTFGDVTDDSWFKPSVDFVTARGIMNGVAENEFAPQGTVTRGMVVATLQRMENKNYTNTNTSFTDVKPDAWYAASVAWAFENGIVSGMSETEFAPEASVTREQLAIILDKYMKYLNVKTQSSDLSAFSDNADISEWAAESISNVVGAGIIGGSDGKINAKGNATRAEYAAMLSRCIKKICE